MSIVFRLVLLLLVILSLRGARWAYAAFVVLAFAYFPARVGFDLQPRPCQIAFDLPLAIHSMTNYPHIVMFSIFFVLSALSAEHWFRGRSVFVFAAAATLVMGALVEIGEGISGRGNCRLRDLIPDSAGIVVGTAAVLLWQRTRAWRERVYARIISGNRD